MTSPYLGQIMMFGGNFAPTGWALCNGQMMSIQQNTALFSLIGTYYGGNGVTTFALPNLQSQLPVHQGQGLGLSFYTLGQTAGTANVTLNTTQIAAHTHSFNATNTTATTASLANNVLPGVPTQGTSPHFYTVQGSGPPLTTEVLNAGVCLSTGSSQPHTNLMPSLCVSFAIALVGIYPTQG
jgi:microcystin-dependent protein